MKEWDFIKQGKARLDANGRTVVVDALIDTGAEHTILYSETAKELGFNIQRLKTRGIIVAGSDEAKGYPVVLDKLQLIGHPSCGLRRVPAIVMPGGTRSRIVIGFPVIEALGMRMDFSKVHGPGFHESLLAPLYCTRKDRPKGLGDWLYPVRYIHGGRAIVIPSKIDTGASMTILHTKAAKELGLKPVVSSVMRGALGRVPMKGAMIDRIELVGFRQYGLGPFPVYIDESREEPLIGKVFLFAVGANIIFGPTFKLTCHGPSPDAQRMIHNLRNVLKTFVPFWKRPFVRTPRPLEPGVAELMEYFG